MDRKPRIRRWVRRSLACMAVIACVVFLLKTAGFSALILPIWWTAVWTSGLARCARRGKRDAALAGTQSPFSRKLSTPLFVAISIPAFSWLFAGAIIVGLTCGPLAGLTALVLGLVTAKVTIIVVELALDYGEIYADFTLSDDGAMSKGRPSTATRWWAMANRPLPRNVQLIASLGLGAILLAILAIHSQWPWWLLLGFALIWISRYLAMVRKHLNG
jgi:hypothetical protein